MSYTPINWQNGDTITAEKMNKMDNGWSVTAGSSGAEICNESVTTSDDGYGAYAGQLTVGVTADVIAVTFDNVAYTCTKVEDYYGAPFDEDAGTQDWSDYPFVVYEDGYVVTENGGTHTFIIAESSAPTVETSTEFQAAVTSIADTSTMPMLCVSGVTTITEMRNASAQGRLLVFKPYSLDTKTCIITSFDSLNAVYIPVDSNITVTFTDDIFTVITSV